MSTTRELAAAAHAQWLLTGLWSWAETAVRLWRQADREEQTLSAARGQNVCVQVGCGEDIPTPAAASFQS